jgi:membrane protein implicated in regulation of membrane protease activity
MIEFFDGLTDVHWLVLAAVILGARAMMPFGMIYTLGRGVLALGLTAAIVGLALYMAPGMTVLQQFGLAAVVALAGTYGLNWWGARGHRRAESHLDRIFTLTQAIVAGTGRIEIEGQSWPIRGSDLPAGATIKVVGLAEMVRVAEMGQAGTGRAPFESGAPVQVVGLELALEVEKA